MNHRLVPRYETEYYIITLLLLCDDAHYTIFLNTLKYKYKFINLCRKPTLYL